MIIQVRQDGDGWWPADFYVTEWQLEDTRSDSDDVRAITTERELLPVTQK